MRRVATTSLRLRDSAWTQPEPTVRAAGRTSAPAAEETLAPTDPRWVLAMRVSQAMDGPMLPADRRDRLLKIGGLLGLTPFESNLVIAVVQDQARRGGLPQDAAPSLAMIPQHAMHTASRRSARVGWLVAAAIAVELVLMFWLLH